MTLTRVPNICLSDVQSVCLPVCWFFFLFSLLDFIYGRQRRLDAYYYVWHLSICLASILGLSISSASVILSCHLIPFMQPSHQFTMFVVHVVNALVGLCVSDPYATIDIR